MGALTTRFALCAALALWGGFIAVYLAYGNLARSVAGRVLLTVVVSYGLVLSM